MRVDDREAVPPSVIRLCGGLLSTFADSLLPKSLCAVVKNTRNSFLLVPKLTAFRAPCRQAILNAVEETLTSRVSFYSVQRRWELPIDEAGRFADFRTLYCRIMMEGLRAQGGEVRTPCAVR